MMTEKILVMTVYKIVTFQPITTPMIVKIVGSSTGEAKRKTMTIENGIFFFSILTTTGIVEQEQKGVIKANRMAAKLASNLLRPVNFFSIFS